MEGNPTVGEMLETLRKMGAGSINIIGRKKDGTPMFAVIAIEGEDTWKYLLAIQALEIEDDVIHQGVIDALREAVENDV